ncbi:MAG: DUF4298 domain-containing protein [Clostridia bacterium]|nr:DUF4298 domain-containing protein [Clostridia bacterium]
MNIDEQIARIAHMEQILNKAEEAIKTLFELHPQIEELSAYYGSKDWFADYDADRAGLLPKDLKRGVLSEDAVYDLLAQYRKLLQ